jgi:hypothetical protein
MSWKFVIHINWASGSYWKQLMHFLCISSNSPPKSNGSHFTFYFSPVWIYKFRYSGSPCRWRNYSKFPAPPTTSCIYFIKFRHGTYINSVRQVVNCRVNVVLATKLHVISKCWVEIQHGTVPSQKWVIPRALRKTCSTCSVHRWEWEILF